MNKKTMGEKIAELRKRKGLTQDELAETLNVSRQVISKWERDVCWPKNDLLQKIADLFGVSVEYLTTESWLVYKDEALMQSQSLLEFKQEQQTKNAEIDEVYQKALKTKKRVYLTLIILAIVIVGIPTLLFCIIWGFNAFSGTPEGTIGTLYSFSIGIEQGLVCFLLGAIAVIALTIVAICVIILVKTDYILKTKKGE